MRVSRITSKGQMTIPAEIRHALHLQAGDIIQFEIVDHSVIISKISPFDTDLHKSLDATLCEWGSPEDNQAFNCL